VWLALGGLSMAVVTLGIMAYVENIGASLELARTLGFVTFSLTHIYAALSYRNPNKSIFTMETFNNSRLNWALLISLLAILLPTEVDFLQRSMALVSLNFEMWVICIVLASVTLWVSEGFKLIAYRGQDEA
jgi:magnesium-transporting ATPase (P-type)